MDIEYIRGYIDEENLSSIKFANMDLIYRSVHKFSRRRGDMEKGVYGWYRYFICLYDFIRVHENMVQHPSNNISIYRGDAH